MNSLALVLGSSKGVGKAVADELRAAGLEVPTISSKDVDTSDLDSVAAFAKRYPAAGVLVLNTGGPPKRDFFNISLEEWEKYHRQLFLSFCLLLQRVKVSNDGYIFLISSHLIKDPKPDMILSQTYRIASWSMLKALAPLYAKRHVSVINLALGPILTDRLRALNPGEKLATLESKMPMGRVGEPAEVGSLVRSIVESSNKCFSGQTIFLDGGMSPSIF